MEYQYEETVYKKLPAPANRREKPEHVFHRAMELRKLQKYFSIIKRLKKNLG